jgi:hypothetical protein
MSVFHPIAAVRKRLGQSRKPTGGYCDILAKSGQKGSDPVEVVQKICADYRVRCASERCHFHQWKPFIGRTGEGGCAEWGWQAYWLRAL